MRLYITAKGRYVGTQDEAKADGKGWHLELVPDQKADLIAYLNAKLAAPAEPETPRLDSAAPPRQPVVVAPVASLSAKPTPTDFEDWILNEAEVWQVENMFSCLGTRFAELAKAARA